MSMGRIKCKLCFRRARGERGPDIAQTIGLNCSMTHSPGRIEYNCLYFIMSFRQQIHKKKFGKNGFHTLKGTMSHRPLTNASSLKITAAYCICLSLTVQSVLLTPESEPWTACVHFHPM
jgi:hypothetical protein